MILPQTDYQFVFLGEGGFALTIEVALVRIKEQFELLLREVVAVGNLGGVWLMLFWCGGGPCMVVMVLLRLW